MNVSKKAFLLKMLLFAVCAAMAGIAVGCTSDLAEPFDISNLYYEYHTVSDSDGRHIVITKHLVSQSDVTIPTTIYDIPVTEIADSVFAGDSKIQSVTFGKNVESVGSNSFGGCRRLKSVTFNDSLKTIGEYAFRECASLSSVAIPDNTESVGRGAFYGCSSLAEISVPASVRRIGGRAFSGTAWMEARSDKDFVTIGDGILIAYNGGKAEVKTAKTVKQIVGAFAGNTALQKVTLRSGVTSLGDMAFTGCSSLQSLTIPSTVTEIGNSAFYGCTSLEKLVLPESITSIGADAFTNCAASLYVKQGSYAEKYCAEFGLDCFTIK